MPLREMDIWLPRAIDSALHGHRGTLDRVDIDIIAKERKEDEKRNTEMHALNVQINEVRKQTKYIFWTMISTIIVSTISIVINVMVNINQIKQLITNK